MDREIGIGIVGCGSIARWKYAESLAVLPGASLRAFFGGRAEELRKAWGAPGAVSCGALDVLLGVTAALAICRYDFKGKNVLLNYFTSPMYVPSVAFAFVLLQVYSQIGGVPGMARVFIGHFIIILPYIVRNTVSVLHVFNWTLEDAATSLGANPVQVFFKITIPLAKPGILAGALLAFLYSFDEVALSSLLSTPRFITLPIRIMNYMELTFDPTLAAISTLLMLASLILIVLMERLVGLDMFMK